MAYIPIPTNQQLKYKKVTLSSAEVLALNSTPITLIGAPGAGKISVVASCIFQYNFNTAAYVSAGNFNLVMGSNNIIQLGGVITLGSSIIKQSAPSSATVLANTSLQATVTVANPTTGDGTIDIYLWYYVLTL
jgi:hypothetical protein